MKWHKVQARLMIGWRKMPPEMLVEEELQVLQRGIGALADHLYGEEDVDLCIVTHEGVYDDETEPYPEGWGPAAEEMWDAIPGETMEEKREWLDTRLRAEGMIDDEGRWIGGDI